ncbi:PREDICTED: uncharacterized protein LOC108561476 [Nicrophorus vespilloides]|uniref:Uncharacterized protein LOC108561476 n=1 Tax=Nicrophorus vespilloides TaxID=110193 RepID=A0ABM1MK12_NICVS|nr:PREDICTED: uncharacterized protein LOC108561476 [Nicrophorus vespilloides]
MRVRTSAINIILISASFATLFPVHEDYEYIWIDDLPLQDGRLVRADAPNSTSSVPDITTKSPFVGRSNNSDQDWTWLQDALKDIAYCLRSHKFNEYDRRYEKDNRTAKRTYYAGFPRPPLRTLHWEVQKYCEGSFLNCVEYLWKTVREADLKRSDDTSVIIYEQKWKPLANALQIASVEMECKKFKEKDERLGNPFQGPLERFQWRTTASYYMCWYTMNEVPDLAHLNEACDNFASCLDPLYGANNADFRAADEKPFHCSKYSFCPDPCCPKKHQHEATRCWNSPENPCYDANPAGHRRCHLNRTQNTNFRDIVLNRWNVTCHCPSAGFVWDSTYGICVDIDECYIQAHTCRKSEGEACLNTVGSYRCVCKWGFTWNKDVSKCMENEAISMIKLTNLAETSALDEKPKQKSLIRRLYHAIFSGGRGTRTGFPVSLLACVSILFLAVLL